mgnify:CR=1 FL=1
MVRMNRLHDEIYELNQSQKKLSLVDTETRNSLLLKLSASLVEKKEEIFRANREDIRAAESANLALPLLKRLKFDEQKLSSACEGLRQIASLKDPIHAVISQKELDDRLILTQESCPIGVIGMIFESRPDALIQIAALCLKSCNGIVLKGGSEALRTNMVLTDIIKDVSRSVLPEEISDRWITLLESREAVTEMLELNKLIDLIIPRGSNSFVQYIMNNTTIPVLGHADGICHCYIDEYASVEKAVRISIDSKCQYVAACNAIETILINERIVERVLPDLAKVLRSAGVEIRGDKRVSSLIDCVEAVESDWSEEYLDLIISIKVVADTGSAIAHINTYGSSHTDVIVTENREQAEFFLEAVDSADVYWNCSTRFADGFRYGLGAEVGISTHKIHARGPVGLEGLISYKWKLRGDGQIVADYSGIEAKSFTHKDLL